MMRSKLILPLFAIIATAAGLGGCLAPHPYIREGNASSVEIDYGGDIASTLPLAQKHCAQYERVPRLAASGADFAIYDCVRR